MEFLPQFLSALFAMCMSLVCCGGMDWAGFVVEATHGRGFTSFIWRLGPTEKYIPCNINAELWTFSSLHRCPALDLQLTGDHLGG